MRSDDEELELALGTSLEPGIDPIERSRRVVQEMAALRQRPHRTPPDAATLPPAAVSQTTAPVLPTAPVPVPPTPPAPAPASAPWPPPAAVPVAASTPSTVAIPRRGPGQNPPPWPAMGPSRPPAVTSLDPPGAEPIGTERPRGLVPLETLLPWIGVVFILAAVLLWLG